MLFIVASVTAEARPIFPINWNNFTQGNASVNFTSQSNFSIYDQGVNWAEISANLGTLGPGTINLSFSYSTTSNGWWENVYAGYLSGTAPVVADLNPAPWLNSYLPYTSNMTPISGINISAYSTNAGTITTSFAVNGATSLNFGAYPNYWSAMPDHMGTTLTITGLNIDYVTDAVATTTKWEGQSPVDFNATNTVQVPNNAPIQYFYTTDTITLKNTADSTVVFKISLVHRPPGRHSSNRSSNTDLYRLFCLQYFRVPLQQFCLESHFYKRRHRFDGQQSGDNAKLHYGYAVFLNCTGSDFSIADDGWSGKKILR